MAEAHWYVVHTYSGYENKVKIDIENTIKNRNLQDQILEVSVPMQSVVEIKNGVEKAADKKMFPGYVLIHMVMNTPLPARPERRKAAAWPKPSRRRLPAGWELPGTCADYRRTAYGRKIPGRAAVLGPNRGRNSGRRTG